MDSPKIIIWDFLQNADELEKKLAQSGLIDLAEIGITATQEDLDAFKTLASSKSLFKKAHDSGHAIDIIIRENFIVDASKETQSYEGAFVAAFIRRLLIAQNKSFSFETVRSHTSKIDEISNMVTQGYTAYLYFICTDSPDVNVSRVTNRVEKGGHEVPKDKIITRYYRTLDNLYLALPYCYRAYLFDNSGKPQVLIAEIYKGIMELKTEKLPNWFIKFVLPYYTK
ncbi:zeta toxin family protein [Mariniflexile sp.]|uniref:zeta toxin family protein n=1 Tax=Mariniflexile sp. TaxID=1979402 RepID=UPI004047EDA8